MIVVNAIIETSADNIAAMKDAIAAMEAASRAESGCHDYTFSVELNHPDILRITEQWQSMDDLAAHFTMPHMADWRPWPPIRPRMWPPRSMKPPKSHHRVGSR